MTKRILVVRKNGYTLVASLILLVVMSMLGIVAVNMSIQESKIAVNYETSVVALAWAEAGVEFARQRILTAPNPNIAGFSCSASDPSTHNWYPSNLSTQRKVKYCIELLKVDIQGDKESNRGSGQDQSRMIKTYYYKIDSIVPRSDNQNIVIRRVQTFEQQTVASI